MKSGSLDEADMGRCMDFLNRGFDMLRSDTALTQ